MSVNEKKVPKRRFKEFQNADAWEQRKLLDCIQKITDFRGRTPKKLGMDWSENGYLALSALNVKDGYIDFSQDVHYGDQALYDKWMSGNELHEGQVLFTTEAPMGNVAQVPDNKRYILSQRTIAFDVKEDIITENFLATLLRSPAVFNTLTSLSSGGTAKGVSQKSLAGVDMQIPTNLNEQALLADYFHNLDHLITLHKRKLDKLKSLKKAYLRDMFPAEGESKPKLRFSGFTDNWEQHQLGDIADVTKLAGFEFTEHVVYSDEGNIIALRGLNIKNGKLILDDVKYIDGSNFNKLGRSKLYIDDILFTYVGTIGEVVIINENDRFYLAPNVSRIRIRSEDSPQYISHYMRSDTFYHSVIFPLITTSSQPALSMENIRKFLIYLPKEKEEQEKISRIFTELDSLITLHQRKLEKLQNIKKAYLNEMFI